MAPALPVGDFDGHATFGLGGGLSVDYYFNENFHLGIEGEYIKFGEGEDLIASNLSAISIQLTGAYHTDLSDVVDFYIGSGIGIFIMDNEEVGLTGFYSGSIFGITPRVGVALELTDQLFLDFNLRYGLGISKDVNQGGGQSLTPPNVSYIGFNLGLLYSFLQP